jgi:hypothetical protein
MLPVSPSSRSSRSFAIRLLPALQAGAVLAIPVVLALLPLDALQRFPDVCLWQRVFGIECWGCGMTRAIASALKGEFSAAIGFNWRVVIVFPLLAAITARFLWRSVRASVAR